MNRLGDGWKDIRSLVVYGLGVVGRRNIGRVRQDFHIPYLIDNHYCEGGGQTYEGIPVKRLEAARPSLGNDKIVVMGRAEAYRSIAQSLDRYGLKEYRDYCGIEQFLLEWYWRYRGQVCLLQVDMAVALKCTLSCKDCNMFIPYHQEKIFGFHEMRQDVDLLFRHVDYLSSLMLLGGEPLLNPELGGLISYLYETYGSRIGKACIVTNGTVVPSVGLLDVIQRHDVEVNISDYTKEVPYGRKMEEVMDAFKGRGIPFQMKRDLTWCEFGFPQQPCRNQDPERHMHSCATLCHGLNGGRYYYCNVAWSAGRLGLFKEKETDYIDLKGQADREMLVRHTLGDIPGGMMFCKFCGGFGSDNERYVKAGTQMQRGDSGDGRNDKL